LWLAAGPAVALSLQDYLDIGLKRSPKLEAARHDATKAREKAKEAWGDWYPEATVTAWGGRELQDKPTGEQTNLDPREFGVGVNQLLYDFGKTGAAIDMARLAQIKAELAVQDAEQAFYLEAVTAYVNLIRAHETLEYARHAETNIRKQTGMEEARAQAGGGYTTDVLQAKAQLAGAQARRVRAEGQFDQALNRFRNLFGDPPGDMGQLVKPRFEMTILPRSVDEALSSARDGNLQIKVARLEADLSREQVRQAMAKGFFPRLELVGDAKRQFHYDGTPGTKQDLLAKVQLKLPFNLGLTALNSVKAAESGVSAAESRVRQADEQIEETVRNAFLGVQTALNNWRYLQDQASLANAFLDLARKEREMGSRSLLDVLNGETTAINALSDASSAEADVTIAAVTLVYRMGTLTRAEMANLAAAR
jgi:adhesin transport system outer membrane protein